MPFRQSRPPGAPSTSRKHVVALILVARNESLANDNIKACRQNTIKNVQHKAVSHDLCLRWRPWRDLNVFLPGNEMHLWHFSDTLPWLRKEHPLMTSGMLKGVPGSDAGSDTHRPQCRNPFWIPACLESKCSAPEREPFDMFRKRIEPLSTKEFDNSAGGMTDAESTLVMRLKAVLGVNRC
jgi:hypothetical protein